MGLEEVESMKAEPQVDTDVDKGSSSTGDSIMIKMTVNNKKRREQSK